jgi:hypothetical protein
VESVGIDKSAVGSLRLGSVVEDPDDCDHREENVTGGRCLKGGDRRVDKRIDGGGRENESRREKAGDLVRVSKRGRVRLWENGASLLRHGTSARSQRRL